MFYGGCSPKIGIYFLLRNYKYNFDEPWPQPSSPLMSQSLFMAWKKNLHVFTFFSITYCVGHPCRPVVAWSSYPSATRWAPRGTVPMFHVYNQVFSIPTCSNSFHCSLAFCVMVEWWHRHVVVGSRWEVCEGVVCLPHCYIWYQFHVIGQQHVIFITIFVCIIGACPGDGESCWVLCCNLELERRRWICKWKRKMKKNEFPSTSSWCLCSHWAILSIPSQQPLYETGLHIQKSHF